MAERGTAFVHIPRTGGLALTEALRGSGIRAGGHNVLPEPGEDCITILRDPVARFVSAYDHQQPDLDIEELARDPSLGGWFFQPAARWLDGLTPVWVGHTETLAADVDRLGVGPLPAGYNASTRRSSLSPDGIAAVRRYYAEDYDLLERLS